MLFFSSWYEFNQPGGTVYWTNKGKQSACSSDALIRNIRGEKVIAVVNELYECLWVEYTSLLSRSNGKREFVPYSSDRIVFIFWLITNSMHGPNISFSLESEYFWILYVFEATFMEQCSWLTLTKNVLTVLFFFFAAIEVLWIWNVKSLKYNISWRVCSKLTLWWNFKQHFSHAFLAPCGRNSLTVVIFYIHAR